MDEQAHAGFLRNYGTLRRFGVRYRADAPLSTIGSVGSLGSIPSTASSAGSAGSISSVQV